MWDAALEPIDKEQCLELLKRVEYGRVAVVTRDGRPEIFPVNYAVHGHTVVFITGSAVMQAWAPLGHVAFEADYIDPSTHEGWDVVVTGEGADITDSRDPLALAARAYAIKSWAPGRKDHWISILNPHFNGRRLYTPAPAGHYY
jgi:nitroimidazol reductase NimA-like FMN-containing flavoprotein (pyridoxamine 5'-phosphate oxidase superfamily)